ncbi:MAG: radical SAM protein [Candidatus Sericytochromatia bacterium]|nr:radical SAM protein [Candidatus Tanganyikabacteria bacterium]
MLALTNACNLACLHCYREEAAAFPDELGPMEIVRVLREFGDLAAAEGRAGVVIFSGGEPLLSRLLGLYARTALGLGLGVRINTNAILATPAVSAGLFAWGIRFAQVSLDGATPEEHEAIRGGGTWELTRRGVVNLLAAGVDVAFKVTLIPGRNDRDPAGYLRVARAWGVGRVSFARAVEIGPAGKLGRYTPEAYRQVLERLAAGRDLAERSSVRDFRRVKSVIAEIRDATFDRSFLTGEALSYQSEEGHSILAVDADGSVYGSRRLPLRLGNVREASLADLWRHPLLSAFRDSRRAGKCERCDLLAACRGGSRAAAWSATGDPAAPDPGCWVEP